MRCSNDLRKIVAKRLEALKLSDLGIQEDLIRERGRIGKNNKGKWQKLYGEKTGIKHKKQA